MAPSAQPWIFGLPDEILVTTFAAVRGDPPELDARSGFWESRLEYGTRDIQNVRLTCRRFYNTSSKFLIAAVSVEATYESLARLEEISSHPIIGPGVMAIQLHLAAYNKSLAVDRTRFVQYQTARLHQQMTLVNGGFFGPELTRGTSKQADLVCDRQEKALSIIRAWEALIGEPDHSLSEEDSRYQRILVQGFKEFADRSREQREILERGILFAKVTSALRRMLAVRHLRIHDNEDKLHDCDLHPDDCDHETCPLFFKVQKDRETSFNAQLTNDEELCKALSKRQSMFFGLEHHPAFLLDEPGIRIIPLILTAFDAPDVPRLASLNIEMSAISSFLAFSTEDDARRRIGLAMRSLRSFHFIHHGPAKPRSGDELRILRDFLGPIINVESLEGITVRLKLWNDGDDVFDPAALPLISIINARTVWPNLTNLTLDTLLIEQSDLTHLLHRMKSKHGSLGVYKIHLTDGSWAAILDVLKERGYRWPGFSSPSGAECEDMSPEDYRRIFGAYGEYYLQCKEADMYISGCRGVNPLIVLPGLDSSLQN
ncbi:hypothetical protein N0V82_008181 [Gnomoniopsis sp. IMI 355080]|nr:hypothetical protein N0V82_008181 [Gnomoniopsis sp. IMI 355080]